LIGYLSEESCPVANIFIDWNPIFADSYETRAASSASLYSGSVAEVDADVSVEGGQEPQSLFAKLISECKKLQVCFLRASNLTDKDLRDIYFVLKPESGAAMNRNLKVLDLSYNKFSGEAVREFAQVFEINRSLEFVGLAKNNLRSDDVLPLLNCFGKVPFPAENVESHQKELKNRDVIVEKNKKLRQ